MDEDDDAVGEGAASELMLCTLRAVAPKRAAVSVLRLEEADGREESRWMMSYLRLISLHSISAVNKV